MLNKGNPVLGDNNPSIKIKIHLLFCSTKLIIKIIGLL